LKRQARIDRERAGRNRRAAQRLVRGPARRDAEGKGNNRARAPEPAAPLAVEPGHVDQLASRRTWIVSNLGSLAPYSLAPVAASLLRCATISSEMRSPGSSCGTPGG